MRHCLTASNQWFLSHIYIRVSMPCIWIFFFRDVSWGTYVLCVLTWFFRQKVPLKLLSPTGKVQCTVQKLVLRSFFESYRPTLLYTDKLKHVRDRTRNVKSIKTIYILSSICCKTIFQYLFVLAKHTEYVWLDIDLKICHPEIYFPHCELIGFLNEILKNLIHKRLVC